LAAKIASAQSLAYRVKVVSGKPRFGATGTVLICDLFIRSYWKDFDWLQFCLASIAGYCRGFRAVVLVLPQSSRPWLKRLDVPDDIRIEFCGNYRDDYLGQQASKLLADNFTDADYVCHVDSDCIFDRPTTPLDLMLDGRPRMLKRPSAQLGRAYPWRKPTEKFLGWSVTDDFMQQQPFLFPRWLYPAVRRHALAVHGCDIETYIESQPPRGFSEYNVLGAFAWAYHRERFAWIDTSRAPPGPPHCRWYWSWGGLDAGTAAEIRQIIGTALSPATKT
jgi:hypothetical protein